MKSTRFASLSPVISLRLALGLMLVLLSFAGTGTDFRVINVVRSPGGIVSIDHESDTNSYYILLQGSTPDNINIAADLEFGSQFTGSLLDPFASAEQRFYRVLQVPLSSPLDVDNDGISDTYEMQKQDILDPLNSADASQDPDEDGLTNLQEYLRQTDPESPALTIVRKISPGNDETGVAVTRETIVEFSQPLDTSTVITTSSFYAESNGRRILSRVELSSDRRKATLFYLENLPGSSVVRVTLNGAGILDHFGRAIDADGDGSAGGVRSIEFQTLSISYVRNTAIVGRVFASELVPDPTGTTNVINTPLADVYITVDGTEESLSTFTDEDGNFFLDCPAGRFFVHVDGRTAIGSDYPNGDYYPVVGKAWEAVAGRSDNLAGGTGEIYLPLIRGGTLQAVSDTTDTTISFSPSIVASNPALAGVSITVPANSLFSDNGARGGRVGIAPVAPNRLPEPLPPGLNFPLVITVQTDGPSNFDRPVPVRFPNLPDPITGVKLPSGAKSALWSFNHDTGRWEIQGPMTVSADGNFLDSDPGVGIRQPGWHSGAPGSTGEGGEEEEDVCEEDPEECPECETDADCDDGEECTLNDRCENGSCTSDTPTPQCGNSVAATIDMSGWTEGTTTSPTSTTQPSGLSANGYVCYDGGAWRFELTSVVSSGQILLSTAYVEASFGPNGTIPEADYCYAVQEMSGYYGGDGTHYYQITEAVRAHENAHKQEWLTMLNGALGDIESVIESYTAPCTVPAGDAASSLTSQAQSAIQQWYNSLLPSWNAADPEHDNNHMGGAYAAGAAVYSNFVAELTAYANSQGWAPCPGPAPQFMAAFLGEEPIIQSLSVSSSTNVLAVGQTAQLEVRGIYPDGTEIALPQEDLVPAFSSTDSNIVTVSTNGLVSAVGSGEAAVQVSLVPKLDALPRIAVITFKVPSPLDSDLDALPNAWETLHQLNPLDASDARTDLDDDGVNNLDEFLQRTNPRQYDSDGDGASDGEERASGGNPRSARTRQVLREVNGRQFFLLYDLDTQSVAQRGLAQSSGRAHDLLLLGVNTRYRHWLLHASTLRIAVAEYTSPAGGDSMELPAFVYHRDRSPDSDGDGLSDRAEFIVGSDPADQDSDDDGLSDSVEVMQGSDPLDGYPIPLGVVATFDTPGTALDVCVDGDRAVVADGTAGVALFNIFNGLDPIQIAQVDTSGYAQAVACQNGIAAVADSSNGLAIVDFTDPVTAQLLRQVTLGGNATCVAMANDIVYVGLETNGVAAVEIATGNVLGRIQGLSDVDDIAATATHLFVLTSTELRVYRGVYSSLQFLNSVAVTGFGSAGETGRKLFLCGSTAFIGTSAGYKTVDVSNPLSPTLAGGSTAAGQLEIHDVAHNGSQLLLAVTSSNGGRNYALSLYDTSNPLVVTQRVSFYSLTRPRGFALGHGVAYVADTSSSGLNVVNFLGLDNSTNVPNLNISAQPHDINTTVPGTQVYGGSTVSVGVEAADDFQVVTVDLFIDGFVVQTDTSWPFTFNFQAPARTASKTNVLVQFRATDSGGNTNYSAILSLELIAPPPSPYLVSSYPEQYGSIYDPAEFQLLWDVPIAASNLHLSGFTLTNLGPDLVPGGGDDQSIPLTSFSLSVNDRLLKIQTSQFLELGRYQLRVDPTVISTTNGAALTTPVTLEFSVVYHPNTIFWISDADGFWTDPTRWSGGRVPTNGDPVVIDRPLSNPVITVNTNVQIRSIACVEALVLTNRSLSLTGIYPSSISGPVTVSNGTIGITGSGAILHAPGITRSDDSSFTATNGATFRLPNLTNFTGAATVEKAVRARGAGSRVQMPALTSMGGPFGNNLLIFFPSLSLQALSGGILELGNLASSLDGRVRILADGSGSSIDISRVPSMFGAGLIVGSIEARNGGVITCSNLTTLSYLDVAVNTDSSLHTRQLANLTNINLIINGGAPDFSSISNVSTLGVTARSNAVVTLPAIIHYPAAEAATWKADGAGSSITLPNLASLSGPTFLAGVPKLNLQAVNGGAIDLSVLSAKPVGRIALLAEGASSAVDLSGIREMEGTGSFRSSFDARSGGTILAGNVTNLVNVDLFIRPTGSIPTAQLLSYTLGQVTADAVSPNFNNLLDVTGAGFLAYTGAVVTLPNIQRYIAHETATWEARGPGAQLAFGGLTNLQGPISFPGIPRLSIQTFSGGVIDLTGLNQFTLGRVALLADGTNSLLNLAGLTNLNCSAGFGTAEARNTGILRFSSNGIVLNGLELKLNSTGTVDTPAIELASGADLYGSGTYIGTLINGGEVRAGTSAGTITINGDYIQTSTGRLSVELGGLTPGTLFDQLNVSGTATLSGTLAITRINNYTIVSGDTFRILNCGARAGTFSSATGLTQGSVTLQVNYFDTGVDITAP